MHRDGDRRADDGAAAGRSPAGREGREGREARKSRSGRTASGASAGARRRARGPASRRRGVGRLASEHDRQRLRELVRSERERVERALAAVPGPLETDESEAAAFVDRPPSDASEAPPAPLHALSPASCPICGGRRIACDEVMQLGTLRLSECLRCDHRWTERAPRRWAELGAVMRGSTRSTPAEATPAERAAS